MNRLRVTAAFLAASGLTGCVERLVAIRSEPPGATVYLEGEKVGVTPCDVPYTWYGTRDVVFELKGHREVRRQVTLAPPWWQIPPFDFITDVLLPFTFRDKVTLSETLERAPVSRDELDEVLKRADELRRKSAEEPD